jgi:hypothetical protein
MERVRYPIMKRCGSMEAFHEKLARVFKKSPIQLSLFDFDFGLNGREATIWFGPIVAASDVLASPPSPPVHPNRRNARSTWPCVPEFRQGRPTGGTLPLSCGDRRRYRACSSGYPNRDYGVFGRGLGKSLSSACIRRSARSASLS